VDADLVTLLIALYAELVDRIIPACRPRRRGLLVGGIWLRRHGVRVRHRVSIDVRDQELSGCRSQRGPLSASDRTSSNSLTPAPRQRDPAWIADYRATRPKVERKIEHLMRRRHGGGRARVRGKAKATADFALLATAVNLARLAVLTVASSPNRGWAITA